MILRTRRRRGFWGPRVLATAGAWDTKPGRDVPACQEGALWGAGGAPGGAPWAVGPGPHGAERHRGCRRGQMGAGETFEKGVHGTYHRAAQDRPGGAMQLPVSAQNQF